MVTINSQVAVEPFKTISNSVAVVKGFAESTVRSHLLPLKVMFDYTDNDGKVMVKAGQTVYVGAEGSLSVYAKRIYDIDNVKFILIPLSSIFIIQ